MNDPHLKQMAAAHYENFPVGSRFIPSRYRDAVHLVYTFARVADDIADEGNAGREERLERLNEWESQLLQTVNGDVEDDFFAQLAAVIDRFRIPTELFSDLIVAFKRDVENPIYETFDDVLEYCRHSANPIGRIMLMIFSSANATTEQLSDKICTALQLTNFLQDISVDTRRNRLYITAEELRQFGIDRSDFSSLTRQDAFRELMKFQVERIRQLFADSQSLPALVHKDFRYELKLIRYGGLRILEKIEQAGYDTRSIRPSLTTVDAALIALRALR
jgi:squalene synthase HpnC